MIIETITNSTPMKKNNKNNKSFDMINNKKTGIKLRGIKAKRIGSVINNDISICSL
jgi:hypothetical protein